MSTIPPSLPLSNSNNNNNIPRVPAIPRVDPLSIVSKEIFLHIQVSSISPHLTQSIIKSWFKPKARGNKPHGFASKVSPTIQSWLDYYKMGILRVKWSALSNSAKAKFCFFVYIIYFSVIYNYSS